MPDFGTSRPTLYGVIRGALDTFGERLRVCQPGRVVKFDPVAVTVDVKPLLMRSEIDPETETMKDVSIPIVSTVPVIFPGGGGFRETYPIQKGDLVLLIQADQSIEEWQTQGDERSTDEHRSHHLTDSIAIVGLHDMLTPWTGVLAESMTIGADGGTQIEIQQSRINLSLQSMEAFLLGTTYRKAQTTLNNSMVSDLTSLATALTGLAADMTAQSVASTGTLAALAPGFIKAATDAGSASAQATAMSSAISQFEAGVFLSNIVYGK